MRNNNGNQTNDDALWILGLIGGCAVAVWAAWHFWHGIIVYWVLRVAWIALSIINVGPVTDIRYQLAYAATNAWDVSLLEFWRLTTVAYLPLTLPLIALIVLELRAALKDVRNRGRRSMTVENLMRITQSHSTSTIPLNHLPHLLQNDPPEMESALTPIEFATRYKLVKHKLLHRDKAREVFKAQLGSPLQSLDDLQDHQKALFAVMGSRVWGNRDETQLMLDALNRSCSRDGVPHYKLAIDTFNKLAALPESQAFLKKHRYAGTLLYALHRHAVPKGKLPSSNFLWLKRVDRTLWYALNGSGRQVAWSEAAGIQSHAEWEFFAEKTGGHLSECHIEPAVEVLEAELIKAGLVHAPLNNESA